MNIQVFFSTCLDRKHRFRKVAVVAVLLEDHLIDDDMAIGFGLREWREPNEMQNMTGFVCLMLASPPLTELLVNVGST